MHELFPRAPFAHKRREARLDLLADALDEVLAGTQLGDEAATALARIFPGASLFLLTIAASNGVPTIVGRAHASAYHHAEHARMAEVNASAALLHRYGLRRVTRSEAVILAAPVRRVTPGLLGAIVVIDEIEPERCRNEDQAILAILASTIAPLWPHTKRNEEPIQADLFQIPARNLHESTPFDPQDREAVHMLRNQLAIIIGHAHMLHALGRTDEIKLAAKAIQGAAQQLEIRYLQGHNGSPTLTKATP